MESSQPTKFLPLSVWSTTLAAALTALIVAILSLPLHLMHAGHGFGLHGGGYGQRGGMPIQGMMQHPAPSPGLVLVWVLIALLVVFVYGGIAGAIFGALYNVILSRR
ncbi:MAG TPA: hypothetical protein VGF86_16020 [Candidatus Tumulicola sp.]|jgi:hypothetical protein